MKIQDKISTKKGIIIILAVAIILFGGIFSYQSSAFKNWELITPDQQQKSNTPNADGSLKMGHYIFLLKDSSVVVLENGHLIQTLTPSNRSLFDNVTNNPTRTDWKYQTFLPDQDINFDGYPDIAIVTGEGYGGVNFFYDYYVFNPKTQLFEKFLNEVCNPNFKPQEKMIYSSCKSGPTYCDTTFTFNGEKYVQGRTTDAVEPTNRTFCGS